MAMACIRALTANIVFVFAISFAASKEMKCPFGWSNTDVAGKCVQVFKIKRRYEQARDWCKMFESRETKLADLVSIQSEEENQLIFNLAAQKTGGESLWIGMSSEVGTSFGWAGGSPTVYSNFAKEPSPGSRNCVSMSAELSNTEKASKWFGNDDCLEEKFFACEMFLGELPVTLMNTTTTPVSQRTAKRTFHRPGWQNSKIIESVQPFPCEADVVFVFDFTDYTNEHQRRQEMEIINDIVGKWSLGDRGVRVGMGSYGSYFGFFTAGGISEDFLSETAMMEECEMMSGDRYALSQIFQELNDNDDVGYRANARQGVPFTYVLFSASTDEADIEAADSSILCASSNECKILAIELNGAADLSSVTVPRGLTIKLDSSTSSTSSLTDFLVKNVCN